MKLNGSNIGKSVALCAFLSTVICRLSTASEASAPYRYMLLTDGAEVWPKDTLATNAQVESAQSEAQSASAKIAAQQA
ncbi:MAG: hypothetical protein ACI4QJ_04165, partial [Candidatus Spyradenecus sp.]